MADAPAYIPGKPSGNGKGDKPSKTPPMPGNLGDVAAMINNMPRL